MSKKHEKIKKEEYHISIYDELDNKKYSVDVINRSNGFITVIAYGKNSIEFLRTVKKYNGYKRHGKEGVILADLIVCFYYHHK